MKQYSRQSSAVVTIAASLNVRTADRKVQIRMYTSDVRPIAPTQQQFEVLSEHELEILWYKNVMTYIVTDLQRNVNTVH
jgi:hypothetical protein